MDTADAAWIRRGLTWCAFASGLSLACFFYNGPTSRAIAFEGLLNSGETFAARLKAGFKESDAAAAGPRGDGWRVVWAPSQAWRDGAGLCAAAAGAGQDGHADELRAVFWRSFRRSTSARLWRTRRGAARMGWNGGGRTAAATAANRDGTRSGGRRCGKALDELRDAIAPLDREEGEKLFKDVWAARDEYIQVILYRTEDATDRFFLRASEPCADARKSGAGAGADGDAAPCAVDVHELRLVFRRYLGNRDGAGDCVCGARAATGAGMLFGEQAEGLEAAFVARLAEAKSNVPAAGDGGAHLQGEDRPMEVGLEQVAAHYAISSVFSSFARRDGAVLLSRAAHLL